MRRKYCGVGVEWECSGSGVVRIRGRSCGVGTEWLRLEECTAQWVEWIGSEQKHTVEWEWLGLVLGIVVMPVVLVLVRVGFAVTVVVVVEL